MITRSHFNGIDRELFGILEHFFETLSPRMIYHSDTDLFHHMEKRLTGYENFDGTIYCEFERYDEKVLFQMNNHSLEIQFVTSIDIQDDNSINFIPKEEVEIYSYSYVNTDYLPEVIEEGNFEYFSNKFHEIYNGIDIDAIILSKEA